MARPKKIGLDYFPMDVNFDDEFRALEELHGNDGFTWIIKFWQAAYKTDNGLVDLNDIRGVLAAKTSRILPEKQAEIIKDAITLGLLEEKSPGIYTSNGIQKRLLAVSSEREKDRNYHKNELSDSFRSENTPKRGEIKEKEIKEKEIKEDKKSKSAFAPPTIDEIKSYCIERNNSIDAEKFYAYYESNGWKVGRNPMRSWKAAIVTWEKGGNYGTNKGSGSGRFIGEFEKDAADKYRGYPKP